MIELFKQDNIQIDRQSSKGNQLKWKNKDIWYKADFMGYEGLSEYITSYLLKESTLNTSEYAIYDLEEIKYGSVIYKGVRSHNFLKNDWQIITLERLFKNFTGESLHKTIFKISNHENRLTYLVHQIERFTGLKDFGVYMNKLFTIDALFLNEDRHMHNIAVLMNSKGEFDYCPIFDNGAGLLSDTTIDYPLTENIYQLVEQSHAKTICYSFEEQLEISEYLYGTNLKFHFRKSDVKNLMDNATIYSEEERQRVQTIIYGQMRKYSYLFK